MTFPSSLSLSFSGLSLFSFSSCSSFCPFSGLFSGDSLFTVAAAFTSGLFSFGEFFEVLGDFLVATFFFFSVDLRMPSLDNGIIKITLTYFLIAGDFSIFFAAGASSNSSLDDEILRFFFTTTFTGDVSGLLHLADKKNWLKSVLLCTKLLFSIAILVKSGIDLAIILEINILESSPFSIWFFLFYNFLRLLFGKKWSIKRYN